ncbi:DUF4139 domain-containing protein [Leptospira kobayashii]|uniref:DUF4139 domain-containing protein n=1 Tax=Leptospira kobayashii TaxID=1917830 RepID=A0ABN6K865_9LEPT|nr:DUF4139 domain-containing protein [Leptospira kobayashii]BDA77132.1 DUF4139 domain-containing protein [Leptospira kobayashii]
MSLKKKLTTVCITFIIFLCFGTDADPSFDSSTEEDRKNVSVTIYNGGVGLVRETRNIDLPKGIRVLRFEDVPSQIIPQTVRVKATDPKKLTVFEQNYEYDLISQERLLEKYVGKEVTIYRDSYEKGKETPVKATLIANNGSPVYKIGNEISLGYYGRVTVPTIPDNLFAKPTLVWKLKNDTEKEQELEVSYQTHGMSWSADYILVLEKNEEEAGLNSWVTLNNTSGTRFSNATLQLVAGKVQLVSNRPQYAPAMRAVKKSMENEAYSDAAPEFQQENLSEYYLYTLDQPTTIGYNQTKQVQLFQTENVGIKKYFVFENLPMYEGNEKNFNNADVKYIFKNAKNNNLGRPLPSGTIRVFKADSKGRQQLLGEDTIDHTPENEEVRIKTGQAFDVVANGKRTSFENFKISDGNKASYSVEIRNRKKENIEVRFYATLWGDWTMTKSSHKFTKESSTRTYSDVPIKAGETVKVDYTIETKYW